MTSSTKILDVRIMSDFEDNMFNCPIIDTINGSEPPKKLVEIAEKHYPNHNWELVIKHHWVYPFAAICYDEGDFEGAILFCT